MILRISEIATSVMRDSEVKPGPTKAKADWFDPTITREDESFGKREHGTDLSGEKLDYKGYWR